MSLPVIAFLTLILMIVFAMTMPINIGATSLGMALVVWPLYIATREAFVETLGTNTSLLRRKINFNYAQPGINSFGHPGEVTGF